MLNSLKNYFQLTISLEDRPIKWDKYIRSIITDASILIFGLFALTQYLHIGKINIAIQLFILLVLFNFGETFIKVLNGIFVSHIRKSQEHKKNMVKSSLNMATMYHSNIKSVVILVMTIICLTSNLTLGSMSFIQSYFLPYSLCLLIPLLMCFSISIPGYFPQIIYLKTVIKILYLLLFISGITAINIADLDFFVKLFFNIVGIGSILANFVALKYFEKQIAFLNYSMQNFLFYVNFLVLNLIICLFV